MKNGILIVLGVFLLLVGKMAFADKIEYVEAKKSVHEVTIDSLRYESNKMKYDLAKFDKDKQAEIENIKKDMLVEIGRVKKEDKTIEGKINAMNRHLGGKLARKGDIFYYAGSLYNVNPLLLAAIAMQESGNGSSKAIKTKNNVGGIMANANLGILKGFEDVDISIVEMARILKRFYIDEGLKDISSIGGKYCPIGVSNDKKTNLNQYWIPNVTANYKMLEKSVTTEEQSWIK